MISFIEKITKSNEAEQNFLLRYFSKLNNELKLNILAKHRKLLYSLKVKHSDIQVEEISYIALILAIKFQYVNSKKLVNKKFEDMSFEEIKNLTLLDIKSFKTRRIYRKNKQEKLLLYWGIVKLLKDEGLSFRDISKYLKSRYKFDISYSTLYKTWREIEVAGTLS